MAGSANQLMWCCCVSIDGVVCAECRSMLVSGPCWSGTCVLFAGVLFIYVCLYTYAAVCIYHCLAWSNFAMWIFADILLGSGKEFYYNDDIYS